MKRILFALMAMFMVLALYSCDKPDAPSAGGSLDTEQPPGDNDEGNDPEVTDVKVAAQQSKYYLSATDDLKGKVNGQTAGMKVILSDSKYYAVNERVLSVSFQADKPVVRTTQGGETVSESNTVSMTWSSSDPVNHPVVGRGADAGEYGILCLPGEYSGKFTVVTSRYTYQFNKSVTLTAGQISDVTLDFANPLYQPKRKVGVMGDSISTFDGALCNEDYNPYYPANDPNVTANPSIAVNSKERTYWWMLINNYMQNGVLDVNSSWSGTRVIHEVKNGRKSGKSMNAGFVDRAYDFVDPDIIILHGGTNDHNQSTALGDYTWDLPIGQGDLTKYRSAYIELIKMLQNRYEGVQIIIIIGDRLSKNYEESTLEIARHFGLPYVNFVGDSIDKCSGSHPTYPAFDKMAKKIYDTCKDFLP